MSEQQDRSPPAGSATDHEAPSDPAVRYTDEQRWKAAWERFGTVAQVGSEQPAPARQATDEPPAADAQEPPRPPPGIGRPQNGQPSRSHRRRKEPATSPAVVIPAHPAAAGPEQPRRRSASAADLASATLLRPREDVPSSGWRRILHKATGGTINPGLSAAERHQAHLIRRIRTPVSGRHRIAVVSLKGGIGKTTTTACLGLTLSHYRGDRVVAIDANPDAGTLAERLTGDVTVTVHDLLAGIADIASYADVSAYTYLAERLQVLASGQDPETSHAFDEEQYRAVVGVLERYFNIIITDSGTGLVHSAMAGTLALADSLVVVGAPSVDGATRAAKTLDWLVAHGYGDLVYRSVAVISSVRPATQAIDPAAVREHFADRCRTVVEIPYDPHLVAGGRIAMSDLRRPTTNAFLALAAAVADGFALTGW